MADRPGIVLAPASAKRLLGGPLGALLLLAGAETDGRLAVVEHTLSPRALGAPVHTHRHEDEYSIVLEGLLGVEIDGKVSAAEPGSVVVKPRRIPHAFWNAADQPARLLEIISPPGFESYFVDLAAIFGAGGPPDVAAVVAAAARYDVDLDPASIPRLVAAHGLKLGEP